MKLWLKFILGLVVIPASVAGLLYHLDRSGFFALEQIEIAVVDAPEGVAHLTPLTEKLEHALQAYRGKSLWSLELDEISRKVGGLNWVETHAISRGWPSTLTVKVRPFEVKALYASRNHRFVPVIGDGKLLDPVEPRLAPDVAILDGAVFQARPELRRKAVELLSEIPESGPFSRETVSEIRWDVKEGFRVRMTKTGTEVKLGEDRFAIKSVRVGQVLDYLSNRGVQAKSLDANLSKKVLVRLDEASKDFKFE